MKTIKFRAWDNDNKVMIYDNPIMSFHKYMTWTGLMYKNGYLLNYTMLQFTGLYDRNEKEIYEGDIYSYDNTNAGYGDPNQPDRNIDKIESIEELYFDDTVQNRLYALEVIGNIYENKELLDQ